MSFYLTSRHDGSYYYYSVTIHTVHTTCSFQKTHIYYLGTRCRKEQDVRVCNVIIFDLLTLGTSDKNVKSGGRGGTTVTTTGAGGPKQSTTVGAPPTGEQRKSPMGSAANSPKPPSTKNGGDSSDTEDDVKSESSSGAGPKVPPLKIVLGGGTEQEPNTRNGKNSSNRHLPYVVNTSSGEEKEVPLDGKEPGVTVKVNCDVCQPCAFIVKHIR